MNTFVITELKELDDGSYEEVGTVGGDSKPVIWSSWEFSDFFSFYLIDDFEISQSNSRTFIECDAVCADNIAICEKLERLEDGGIFEKELGRVDLEKYEELTGEKYRFKVYITSLGIGDAPENGIRTTITPHGGRGGETHINIQIKDELLKTFTLVLQSKRSGTSNFSVKLGVPSGHLNPRKSNNKDGLMIDLTNKIEIDGDCDFSFKTAANSGQWITDLIKKEKSIVTKLKRIGWRAVLLAMISIVGGAAGGLLLYYLFEPYLIQLSEWLNSIGL